MRSVLLAALATDNPDVCLVEITRPTTSIVPAADGFAVGQQKLEVEQRDVGASVERTKHSQSGSLHPT